MNERIGIDKQFLMSPAGMLSTWFGSGLMPIAPGTWGSLAALPFAYAIQYGFGWQGLAMATVLIFLVGCWAATRFEERAGVKDPGAVVIDEVAGQWLVLIPAGLDPIMYLFGFFLFRACDIFKPWPASWADQNVNGGLGIMLDDVLAGIYGLVALYFVNFQMTGSGLP